MRIELPSTSWADTPHAQDDAHTLTLPPARPLIGTEALLAAVPGDGETLRAAVAMPAPQVLTVTF